MLALRVPRALAEVARTRLQGLIDGSRGSRQEGPWVDFPLRAPPPLPLDLPGATLVESPAAYRRRYPREPILRVLELLPLPQHLKALVPRRWERIGDVILLRLPPELRPLRRTVGEAFARGLRASTVVEQVGPIRGVERAPQVEVIFGGPTETLHRENGVLFRLDVAKVMFSSGNLEERIRMARVGRPGEVVVDLFAGIGYFTLPLALHGGARVHACEISPTASGFLRANVALNRVQDRVVVLEGDCRKVAPRGVADRVVLGYLWDGPLYLPTALGALGKRGILHFHALERRAAPGEPWRQVRAAAAAEGREVRLLHRRRVKSYAPAVDHVVLDVAVEGPTP